MPASHTFRRGTVLAGAALLSVALLGGCTSAVDEARGEGSSAEPTQGGTLVMASTTDHIPATPYQGLDAANAVNGLVYESLINYPADSLDPQPNLATAWEISEDGLTVTLTLRDDVTFHSGRPFTSEDVEFSLKNYAQPQLGGQWARTAAMVTGVDTSEDHTVVLTLAQPLNNLLDLLDVVPIIDRETADTFTTGEEYVGTGPFTFGGWTPSSKMTFEANENYWGGRPNLDSVELVVLPDPQTQIAQLRSGQVDVVLRPAARDVDLLAEDPAFNIVDLTGVEFSQYLGVNVAVPGLDDVRVRQAIAFAVDRERVLDEVYGGHGNTDNLPWPDYSPAYSESLNSTYTRDLDKARDLVEEAGEVPPITLNYAAGPTEQLAQIIQTNLEEAGLEIELAAMDTASFTKAVQQGSYEGLWINIHSFANYTPSTLPVSAFPFNSERNSSNFVDPEYREIVAETWAVADPGSTEAKAAYDRLSQSLLDNAFVIELTNYDSRLLTSSAVSGIEWSKKFELDLRDASVSK